MRNFLSANGTKVIGAIGTAVGSLSVVDPSVLAALLGPKGLAYFTAISGILTILRGVKNTKAQAGQ